MWVKTCAAMDTGNGRMDLVGLLAEFGDRTVGNREDGTEQPLVARGISTKKHTWEESATTTLELGP